MSSSRWGLHDIRFRGAFDRKGSCNAIGLEAPFAVEEDADMLAQRALSSST